MDAAETLRAARRRAGFSQRELHRLTGIAQPTIARIESGLAVPRLDTFESLLEACGETLVSAQSSKSGTKAALREQLAALPQAQRIELLLDETMREETAPKRRSRDKSSRAKS